MNDKKRTSNVSGLRRHVGWLKELTYNERFLKAARRLPFSRSLRSVYQMLSGGGDNILRVTRGESEVLFQVHSPREYRAIESNLLGLEQFFLGALELELREGLVFLDVGSSFGEFVIPMAKKVGSAGMVIGIEPEIDSYKKLEANVRLNGFRNVRLFRTALSDQGGEAQLWCDGACPTLWRDPLVAARRPSTTSNPSAASELVSVEVGDHLMERERLPIPRAVKIDVEGFEYQVIRGLSRTLRDQACNLLCCEIHPPALPSGITPQVIIDEVKSLGFREPVLQDRCGQIQMVTSKG